MKCHNCSSDNPSDARFCQNCGQPLERVCPNCSTSNNTDAKFCKQCGAPLTGSSDRLDALRQFAPQALQDKIHIASVNIEGERKPVTILFTDIVGSTSYAEKLDPEEWKEIISGAHQRVSEAVYRYEGTIAQLLGDGVLAFFGAPITHEDDPIRAVRAGLDIQQSITEYSRQLKGYIDNFQMRIGINTGTVIVGPMGSDMHMEYTAIGDAVNLAARLQSAAEPGGVLISEVTERMVRAAFDLKALGEIIVKGKAAPVRVFEVVEAKGTPSSGRGIEGLFSPLVGRDQELLALRAAFDEVLAGHGQIAAVLGEAGIGKTRLVEEARNERAGMQLRWLEGRALSYGQTLSFWSINQLIKNDLGLSEVDLEAKIKVTLRRRANVLFGDRAAEVLPYLAHLIGVQLDDESAQRIRQLDGETLKRQILWAIGEYFQRVAHEQPTVLVFEDFHWADPSTLDALDKLLVLSDRAPLLLLLLARIEREHGSWQIKVKAETDYAHRYTEINLKPLSSEDSNELVNHLLDVANLPDSTRRLILERSEGNPFYLEEIIRSLIEQGALVHEGSAWHATADIASVEIPPTLQGVLLARIDRLQEDVRRTLQLASVIGKSFLFRLLEAIATAERQLDEHLSLLQRADLVREKARRPELEYIFKHSLTQEAAYSSLLIERRKEFHQKVGEALEQLFADRAEEFYGLLAHHFDAAGNQAKAIDYLIQAGDKSRLEDAHEEAIRFYRRAIELLNQSGDVERTSKTWLKLGLIYQVNFEFDQAHQANETAFALERKLRASRSQIRATPSHTETPRTLRMSIPGANQLPTLDPSITTSVSEFFISSNLFVGLAEFDSETNVVPHAARSWEVLDGGTRYVFHLRDDIRWTDGRPLTAADFEQTWKRNLAPSTDSRDKELLNDIVGARDYREGREPDPDQVGVRAIDPLTLEVQLTAPVAYFIYLVTQPITFPLPLKLVEEHGDEWWKPEHIISNGPFRLLEFDAEHGRLGRNPDYFGEFSGNLDQFRWKLSDEPVALRDYLDGQDDYASWLPEPDVPAEVPASEKHHIPALLTLALHLSPDLSPLDDVRVRRAILHAIDREQLNKVSGLGLLIHGGIVPPGMAGHSPELGLEFNLEQARWYLAEAGYPNGKNLPILKYHYLANWTRGRRISEEFKRQWFDHLGIQIELVPVSAPSWTVKDSHIHYFGGWAADYPDPDNFLRQSSFYRIPRNRGWRHSRLEQLLEAAARTTDRAQRLAMYREADRILVNEEAVAAPLGYSAGAYVNLVKPWVKGCKYNAMGTFSLSLKDIVIEPH